MFFTASAVAADEMLRRAGENDEMDPWACRKLQYPKVHFKDIFTILPGKTKAGFERLRNALLQHNIIFSRD